MTRYRWRICALLFAATTINYMDRQALGVLAPHLQTVIGWNEVQYGYIVTAFQGAYAIGLLAAGGVIDRVGTRLGYALAISIWSLAAMSHALVSSVAGFAAARFFLGLGEAGNFPSAIKAAAEWFPRKERALAAGIVNAGSNVGAVVAPIVVPLITVTWGWQWAFVFTGALSATWLVVWMTAYRNPGQAARVNAEELAHIRIDDQTAESSERVPWRRLLPLRQTWVFVLGKLMTDPIWWLFLSWLPKFLNSRHGLTLTELGLPLVVIYLVADAGSIGGGWLAASFMKRGWSVNRARKTAMFCCACCVLPVMAAASVSSLWTAVAIISLAAAGHQGWSANLFTLTSDLFPNRAVASVVGIGGFGGAIGGMAISTVTGWVLETTGSYVPVFLIAGFAYLTALLVLHFLSPGLKPAELDQPIPEAAGSAAISPYAAGLSRSRGR